MPASPKIFRTVVAETVRPSPLISPAIRWSAPARVLARETEDELADLTTVRAAARVVCVGPAASNEPSLPPKQRREVTKRAPARPVQ
jgi:hypothetical protein